MAIRPLNSVAGFSVGETPANIILANGDITTTNITTTGVSNLNSISNVKISGGGSGQVIATDGAGNLSFITVSTAGLSNGTSNIAILNNGNITFSVAGNANVATVTGNGITIAGTLSTGTGVITGNGSGLTALTGANVTGTVPSATTAATATTAGTVTTAAQPNITSVGTLTSLGVSGTVTAAAFTANTGVFTGNGSGLSAIAGANVTGQVGNALVAGTVYTAAQPNITSVGTLTSLGVSGNITAANITANTGVFTGNGSGLSAIAGANVTGTVSAATTAGTVTTAAQPNITSVGTLTSLGVSGNITAANITANTGVFTGNGSGLTALTGANVTGTVSSATTATTAGTVTTAAQPNITSVGTLTSLGVNGTVTAVAFTANTGVFTGNGSGLSAIAGANVTGTVASATAATTAGTVTTAAQPNITSVGTLSSLTVTGTASAGNLSTGGTLTATGNVSGGNLTTAGVLTVSGTGVSSIAGNLDMTSNTIINLATPTNPTDAATKQYVDDVAQGLHTHDSCNAATDTTLAIISGGTVTYNNGSSGVGATLTTTGSYTTIDGVTLTNGMRILVKNEANTAHNGIYDRTSSTVLTRSSDFDTPTEMAGGDFTFVTAGTLYDNTGWVMPDVVTTVGTSPVVWIQFSGAGTYTAGTGLNLNGSQFNISNTTVTAASYGNGDRVASFTVNAQGQLTAASNVVIAANAANLTGTTLASSIVNSSLTSVGTLGSLNVTGNANVGNLGTGGLIAATGNVSGGNLTTGGVVAATGNVSGGNLTTGGALSVTGNANVGNIGATTAIFTTGNITTINSGLMQNGNSNVTITANGNVTLNAVGGARITATSAGANVTGTLGVSGNANVGNLGTAQVLASANVTAPQIISNVATGTAPLVVSSTTQVANLNAATAGTAGTVTTAAQPNITSVGTLTSLGVSGNITAANITANTGVFTGNGSGLSAIAGANVTGTVPSATTATTAGTVTTAAQPNITSVGTLTSLSVTGNVSTGNISGTNGNLTTANVSGNLILGNSSVTTAISWASATTTSVTANQTIASFSATGITGVQFLVKGIDSTGSKYSVATVQAVTDGTNVDYSTFGTVNLGGFTGALAVNIVGGFVRLQVTPASSNSTVWTTQYRFI